MTTLQLTYAGPADDPITTEHDSVEAVVGYANVMYGIDLPWGTLMRNIADRGDARFDEPVRG